MSVFVNSHALISYIPITWFLTPFAITGHFFALRAADLAAVHGWQDLENRFDDDNELARRLAAIGLTSVQTPVIYAVANEFDSWRAYAAQIKRWFVFPRQTVAPYLTPRQRHITTLLSAGMFPPVLSTLLALAAPSPVTLLALLVLLAAFALTLAYLNIAHLHATIPVRAWLLIPVVAIVTPVQILWALVFSRPTISWRGQTYYVHRGGEFTWISGASPSCSHQDARS
jgi:ceramide glucosyltransferase